MPTSAGSSDFVPLLPASLDGAGSNPDDAPTIITPNRQGSPSDPSIGLAVGSILGHYELLGSVGVGGMGAVLKARDLELNRIVALKILPPRMARDPDSVTRFKQEARAGALLDHDNIARVFSIGEDQGLHFIAFEFVDGENLRTLIERRGTIPPAECVRYMLQVAAGLAHAVTRGVIHRDIKPSNIVVTTDGKAKIVDMGLARNLSQSVNGGLTQSGVTLGTFDYISPEQAIDPRRVDIRSDIYSLGCAFYHALTGRPPVPEGTAAKKLNAHQHEPVLDPRVLNPQIPDELAIILAKMMAKDANRRYQSPTELIAVLTAMARLLNLSPEAMLQDPSALPADSSTVQLLPQPPKISVVLLAGIAVLVAAVVIVVSLSNTKSSNPIVPKMFDTNVGLVKSSPPAVDGSLPIPPPQQVEQTVAVANTLEQFVAALKNPSVVEIQLEPGHRYDFTRLSAGLVVQLKKLLIEPKPNGVDTRAGPPIIRLAAVAVDPLTPSASRAASLTFAKMESLVFRGVQFEIAEGSFNEDRPERFAGVVVSDVGKLELLECRFDADRDLQTTDVIGLSVIHSNRETANLVSVRNTYFGLRRGVAVQLSGRINVDVQECAFTPHPAVFALRGDPEESETSSELTLRSCTFLMEKGAVVEAEANARWLVSAGYCVFGTPAPDPALEMMAEQPERRASVLRMTIDKPDDARFRGRIEEPNAYYRVDPFSTPTRSYTFDECKRDWTPNPVTDATAVELRTAPWAATDPTLALGGAKPWEAFRLKTTLRAVRIARSDVVILGVKDLPRSDAKIYDPWPPPRPESATEQRVKIVYPNAPAELRADLPRSTYLTLDAAIAEAKADDVIQIRHDGQLEVPQTTIDRAKLRLTIKPYPGSTPILIAAKDNNKLDACLFRLIEGQLTLDSLEIRLRPRKGRTENFKSLSVVSIVAGRECTLKNCTVTLDEKEGEILAAILLTDADGEMRTDNAAPPVVKIEQSLIRGSGRGIWVPTARPFDLNITNSILTLAGSVVDIDPPSRVPMPSAIVRVQLEQVTALLGGSFFNLNAGRTTLGAKPLGWVPVDVTARRCLFAAYDDTLPFITVLGADPASLNRMLTWNAARTNWYANFPPRATWMELIPADDMQLTKNYSEAEWFTFTGENAANSSGKVTFATPAPMIRRKFTTVESKHLAVERVDISDATPNEVGATVSEVAKPNGD